MTQVASTSGYNSPGNTLGRSTRSPGRGHLKDEDTLFGYESPPDIPALNREVFKWVQSLDLSHALKNVRRDAANGFLVAEIFSRYFPADIQMHGFANNVSSHYKKDNWAQLQRFSERQGIDLPADLVEGTLQGVHGAAIALLEHLYELFTGKKVKRMSEVTSAMADTGARAAAGGDGDASKDTPKTISTQLKSTANVEFGAVETRPINDAADLRRQFAGAQ